MSLSQQLSAMVFELRAAGSPVAKAKALARAWRFVRRLSPTDRKVLAREAGFDGAEDFLETLATKKGGIAPAMLLQLLGSLRSHGEEDLGALIGALEDPATREDVLLRGVDALAGSLEPEVSEDRDDGIPIFVDDDEVEDDAPEAVDGVSGEEETPLPEPAAPMKAPPVKETIGDGARIPPVPEPSDESPPPEPSTAVVESSIPPSEPTAGIEPDDLIERLEAEPSLVVRLLEFRDTVEHLEYVSSRDLRRLVEIFPEGWARRRAVTALLDAGIPEEGTDALELISILDSAADRRWCLKVLIELRDLEEGEVGRALEMTRSPILKRRIRDHNRI
jgi:hypothetical protein